MLNSLILLKDIVKVYAEETSAFSALNKVSLQVDYGEFIAIMGASGSGKSTLLNIIGTLDRPTSGEYYFENKLVNKYSNYELAKIRNKKIGFIFQSFNLLGRYTALANVELPMTYAGIKRSERREKAIEFLKLVGLEDKINHRPDQLSGGEQQRVSIARALVNNPVVLLADEPTGSLDSKNTYEIMKLLAKLNEMGKTIILVTHDPNVANYAKRMVYFKDGQIVKEELKKEL